MKVTEPIDVYIAEKLFQLSGSDAVPQRTDEQYHAALEGKTLVVFGGSYGIGSDIAELAKGYGATVLSFSRSGTGTHVERREDVATAAAEAIAVNGRIDYVVNTAGVLPRGLLQETSEETVYNSTEINYLAPIFIAQAFFPHLAASRGSLLLFTSSSYTRGRGGYSLYSSAKAAVVNLTQALADEWSGSGVKVNCINPERTANPHAREGLRRRGSRLAVEVDRRREGLPRHAHRRRDRPRGRRTPTRSLRGGRGVTSAFAGWGMRMSQSLLL